MKTRTKLALLCVLLGVAACLWRPASARAEEDRYNVIIQNHTNTVCWIFYKDTGLEGNRLENDGKGGRLGFVGRRTTKPTTFTIHTHVRNIVVTATDSAGHIVATGNVVRNAKGDYVFSF